jgi:hypothetical protein
VFGEYAILHGAHSSVHQGLKTLNRDRANPHEALNPLMSPLQLSVHAGYAAWARNRTVIFYSPIKKILFDSQDALISSGECRRQRKIETKHSYLMLLSQKRLFHPQLPWL